MKKLMFGSLAAAAVVLMSIAPASASWGVLSCDGGSKNRFCQTPDKRAALSQAQTVRHSGHQKTKHNDRH